MAILETMKKPAAIKINPASNTLPSENFAVIKTGGKQYKVKTGDVVKIEKIAGVEKGGKINFAEVLLVDNGVNTKVGNPTVSGASVEGEVVEAGRNAKIVVIHYKQKSRYYKKAGHRQPHLKVKITNIKS